MTPQDFVYWLQGYLELSDTHSLTIHQVEVIKQHLQLALKTLEVSTGTATFDNSFKPTINC
jgi:hypothetical protein